MKVTYNTKKYILNNNISNIKDKYYIYFLL